MMKRKLAYIVLILAGTLILALFIIMPRKGQGAIKIGAIVPLTGDNATYGVSLKKGMDLAVEQINTSGGIRGKKLYVVYEDDQANAQKGIGAFYKLTNVDNVPLVLGAMFSSVTLAIAPIAEKNKIVLLSPTSSATEITNAGDYIFRIYPSDSSDGIFLADFAFNTLHLNSVSILNIQVASVSAIVEVFKEQFIKYGGEVLNEESYAEGSTDFRTQLMKIKKSKTRMIFMPGYLQEMAIQLIQAKEIGVNKQILTISTLYDPKIFELAQGVTEGVIFSTPYFNVNSEDPNINGFVNAFKLKYGDKPDIWAGYGYDSTLIAAAAIRKGGTKADNIKAELYKVKEFPGVTGMTSFDNNGDVEKPLRMMIVKNGEFVTY